MANRENSSSNVQVFADKFSAVSARIWRAAVAADVDPQLSHIEVMFGSGSVPWNGTTQRQVTYYLSSHRTTDLVLLSFNACIAMCTDEFPRCYRVTYAKQATLSSHTSAADENNKTDSRQDDSVVDDAPQSRVVRQCGRAFPKSLIGVQTALRMARYAHLISLAKERQQWATLVQFSADGSFSILETWPDVDLFMPNVRADELRREIAQYAPDYSSSLTNGVWSILTQLVVGLFVLLLVLALIGFVSAAIRRNRKFSHRHNTKALKR